MGSSSCSIRLVCTIHAFASDLSRKPGIRLHLPLRLFISTLNKSPFCGITRYAMVIMPASMSRQTWDCTADAITTSERPYYPPLNGIGLRTFSVLGIRIYVAGLYLERRNGDPDTILHSRERKLLDIWFLRDLVAEDTRKAWQESFEQNCKPPCYLDTRNIQRLSRRFHPYTTGMTRRCYSEGLPHNFQRPMGDIADPQFAELMLHRP